MRSLLIPAVLAVFLSVPAPVSAKTNILFILDGSNSMWGQIDNKTKMETARETLAKLLSDLPPDADLGFMAYGHRREGDCNDVELLSPLGRDTPDKISAEIRGIQPVGKTPIAKALATAKEAFSGRDGQNNNILLVSDGIESCGGDPCAVAASLQQAGLHVRAHVVGFGVSKKEGQQLTCIAENSGGKYFDAANAEAFNAAVKEVTQIAQAEVEPEPEPEPQATTYFEDDFKGSGLADHWDVANPNPDGFIVEDGELLLIAKQKGGLGRADIPNLIKLTKDLPQGDWTVTVDLTAELATATEQFGFGLYDDAENFLATYLWVQTNCCYDKRVILTTSKHSGGQETRFDEVVFAPGGNDLAQMVQAMPGGGHVTLKLVKQGRTYKSMAHLEGDKDENGNPVWHETEIVTSLRAPKQLVLNASQYDDTSGETLFRVNDVKIETFE